MGWANNAFSEQYVQTLFRTKNNVLTSALVAGTVKLTF
jgi:hypothetical protein